MKVFPEQQSRAAYLDTQIARSEKKFGFCKVSIYDTLKYQHIIAQSQGQTMFAGPIVCMGTRNGREVDLFRITFWGSGLQQFLTKFFETSKRSFVSLFPKVEAPGRNSVDSLTEQSVIGVEVNPRAKRSDVWIGSFDELPQEWTQKFGLVYSNSFDQSQDPYRTAKEWVRITKPGGYIIFCYSTDAKATVTDPVAGVNLEDLMKLFGSEVVYFRKKGSRAGYNEAVIRTAV